MAAILTNARKGFGTIMSKTFIKILFIFILLTLSLLFTFALVTGDLFRNIFVDKTYEKNIKELNIIADSIQTIHDSVLQFTMSTMEDPSTDTLLHQASATSAVGYHAMDELAQSIKLNPYFHSVSLYSGYTGEYFSTLTSHSQKDDYFRNAVDNYQDMAVLSPVCRVLPADVYYTNSTVYSYFFYETNSENHVAKAISVNIGAQWICDYLNRLKGNDAQAYIIDMQNGTFIDSSTQIYKLNETNREFINKIVDTGSKQGSFLKDNTTNDMLVTFQWVTDLNWILVVEEPNNEFQETINNTKQSIIQITVVLILLGLMISIYASRRIYKPWGRLYQKLVGGSHQSSKKGRLYDDVNLIRDSIELSQKQLEEYLQYKNSAKNVLLETYIRALLLEDAQTIEKLPKKDRAAFEEKLSQSMSIMLFQVDHWKQIKSAVAGSKDACGYSLLQLTNSLFPSDSNYSSLKWVYLGDGKFLLIAFDEIISAQWPNWQDQIGMIQSQFFTKTGFTVSIMLGGQAAGVSELMGVYDKTLDFLRYTILFNRQSMLDQQTIDTCTGQTVKYDEMLERALIESVCNGHKQEAQRLLEEILEKYRKGDLYTFRLYLTQLFLNLDKRLENLEKIRGPQSSLLTNGLYRKLPELQTLDDIRENFAGEIQNITLANQSDSRNDTVVTTVKEYVQAHYTEEFGLKTIAAHYNFSPGYLGVLFKDAVGMSVLEYTNNIRLEAAERLIRDTNLNMKDIMQQTGFINESNFYKLFKKKYGLTPKSYRVKHR